MANSRKIHTNRLREATPDNLALLVAVDIRFREVTASYARVHKMCVPPTSLDKDLVLWRTFFVRAKSGDKRCTRDEVRAVRRIAQWTLDMKKDLVGEPRIQLEWPD